MGQDQGPLVSNVPANMLFPTDGAAFDMLARFIDHEYVDPADMWMRGIAASFGIVKGKPFAPDTGLRATLDRAARVAFGMSRAVDYGQGAAFTKFYQDRQWLNAFPGGSPWFTAPTFDQTLLRTRILRQRKTKEKSRRTLISRKFSARGFEVAQHRGLYSTRPQRGS